MMTNLNPEKFFITQCRLTAPIKAIGINDAIDEAVTNELHEIAGVVAISGYYEFEFTIQPDGEGIEMLEDIDRIKREIIKVFIKYNIRE